MPWGVAAVRGTFWSNTVSSTYCGMTILIGDGDLSSAGQTQTLSPGQSSGINRQGNPPSPPGLMSPSEAREWSRQRGWVLERGGDIQNNLGGQQGDNHENEQEHESDYEHGYLLPTLNNALNQALNLATQIPTGISSGGGSGSGGSVPVITRVAAPVANFLSGIYSQPLNISLSSATEGATIYFTIDGSDPKTSSTREVLSTLLNINVNTTIKAYATKNGMTDSDVVTFTYTINLLQVAMPTADPLPGDFNLAITVRLSTTTEGATIYYTTDGSDPKTSLTRAIFSALLNINLNSTIKAYAAKDGMSDSDVVSFDYTINSLPPNVTLRLLDLQRISVNVNGDETTAKPDYVAHSAEPSVSADGRYVAFYSYANNLVQGDTNNAEDIFVKDTKDATVVRVSVTSTGGQSNGGATNMPRITPDGRYVVFRSGSTNLATGNPADDTNNNWDIFVHDRDTDENGLYDEADGFKTIRVSISSTGEQTTHSNFGNCNPSISDNGRFICFSTDATNLVVEGTNGKDHIYVHDRDADEDNIFDEAGAITTRRVSVSSSGDEADTDCYAPEISGNGRYVVFASGATTLVPGISTFGIYLHDLQTGTTSWLTEGTHPQISYDGNYIAFESGNNVYCLERSTGNIQCVSLSISGGEPDKYCFGSRISPNGRFVTFCSGATNLVPDDTNECNDVFIYDRQNQLLKRLSTTPQGVEANLGGWEVSPVSSNGQYVAFTSASSDLVPNDTNDEDDVFLVSIDPDAPLFTPDV